MYGITTLKDLDFVYDPFCEKAFWERKSPFTNPICASTGILMVIMALFTKNIIDSPADSGAKQYYDNNNNNSTGLLLFTMCKTSLAVVGIGTAIFHLIDDQSNVGPFNFRMADRFTMILMCTNIFILYFVKLFHTSSRIGKYLFMCSIFLLYVYMSGLVLAVDSATYEFMTLELKDSGREIKIGNLQNMYETYMNLFMLLPLGLILICAVCITKGRQRRLIGWVWIWIILNLAMWSVNSYACRSFPALFVLHAFFHVTIALTFLFASCVGMTLDGAWELEMYLRVWPMIKEAESENNVEKGVDTGGSEASSKKNHCVVCSTVSTKSMFSLAHRHPCDIRITC